MNRQDHIYAAPADLAENPTSKDTRLSVDFLFNLLDKGADSEKTPAYPPSNRAIRVLLRQRDSVGRNLEGGATAR